MIDLQHLVLHPGSAAAAMLRDALAWLRGPGLRVALFSAAAFAVVVVARRLVRRLRHRRLARGARYISILPPPDVDPTGAETLWRQLRELLSPAWRRFLMGQPHVAFEYLWDRDGVRIGLWVPGCIPPGLVERAVEAAWPAARAIVTGQPPAPIPLATPCAGGAMRLADREWFPLRTDHAADPLRSVFGAARDLCDGEAAAVQILARPLTGRRVVRGWRAAAFLQRGGGGTALGRFLDIFTPGSRPATRRPPSPAQSADIRSIQTKASEQAWEVAARYAVATGESARDRRPWLRGRAHELASAFGVFTARNRLRRRRLRHTAAALASRRLDRGDLLSVPEIAVIAHLPIDRAVAGLVRAGAKAVAPPVGVPTTGKVLGDSEVGVIRPVAIAVPDCRHHLHIVGATGSGKSTLLANLVLNDVEGGRGVVVIDPKGDLIIDLLDRLPASAADRVVLIDPEDASAPPSLNLLDGFDPDVTVDNVVGIFRRVWESSWGPRTDDILRAACLTLLRHRDTTLADVPDLLQSAKARQRFRTGLTDDYLLGFWSWYEELSDGQRAQLTGPVLSKLRTVLSRGFVRSVVGEARSTFDMASVLDGGVCLVRVPKGVLGDDTARLLGSFVLARVWQVAAARARQGQEQRVDAALVVDECQNFLLLPRSFDEMVAEARGYRLSLVLAHQHLAQLPPNLRDAVSTNARSKVLFNCSPEDARSLERHVGPELSAHDLAHLDAYQAAVRPVVGGHPAPAFTLRTRPAPDPVEGRAAHIRAVSRATFGNASPRRRTALQTVGGEGAEEVIAA